MRELKHLFDSNRQWVKSKLEEDSEYFSKLAEGQSPKYLWIGCSDSRVHANEVLGLEPGEVFVHRNVANLFIHTDFNCLSVLQFAVEYLKVEHIIVCGHYGCGGVAAALAPQEYGLVDNWLRSIRDIHSREQKELEAIADDQERYRRLVELNVVHQALNICHTTIVQRTWAQNQSLAVHGWVYELETGLIKDLDCCISSLSQVDEVYRTHSLSYRG